jgi:hypothetical protein
VADAATNTFSLLMGPNSVEPPAAAVCQQPTQFAACRTALADVVETSLPTVPPTNSQPSKVLIHFAVASQACDIARSQGSAVLVMSARAPVSTCRLWSARRDHDVNVLTSSKLQPIASSATAAHGSHLLGCKRHKSAWTPYTAI